ncbi:hypothetical protein PM082_023361 [Marasmius tenuissimus]|nr:hypothetical protein PM082_023361 [Marasmius tenuissimus]
MQKAVIDAVLNAPRSWHDSHVARPIFKRLRTRVPDGYYLVADTAFPQGTASISGKIRAPLKDGNLVPNNPQERTEVLNFNRQLLSYRQTAEWGMRAMQGSFGRLRVPLPIASQNDCLRLLEICCRLFNVRANRVNISQIKNVYMPRWKPAMDEEMWADIGNVFFGEVRRRDRVSRYHLVVA